MFLAGDDRLNDAPAGQPPECRWPPIPASGWRLPGSSRCDYGLGCIPPSVSPDSVLDPLTPVPVAGARNGPQQPMGQQIADPLAVFLVCLLSGNVPHVVWIS